MKGGLAVNGIECQSGSCDNHLRRRPQMDHTRYGLDIAKRVMQVYWVDHQTGKIGRRVLKRSQLMAFFGRRPGA